MPLPRESTHDPELTRALVRLVLVAAVVTAPVFLFGEGLEAMYVTRVAASNGLCVVLCVGLLALLRRGHERLAGASRVYGHPGLVGVLAWVKGEPVHVNGNNFTLIAVLASALCDRREVLVVGALSAVEMVAIAWRRPTAFATEEVSELNEARFEAIVQVLPTFLVVIAVLWLRERRAAGS